MLFSFYSISRFISHRFVLRHFMFRAIAAEEEDQQEEEEQRGDGSGDSDENLAKVAANVSDGLFFSFVFISIYNLIL